MTRASQSREAMYRHTQTGWLLIVLLGLGIVAALAIPGVRSGPGRWLALFFALLLLLFHSMTVRVSPEAIQIWYGVGLVRKSIRPNRIRCVRVARNPWYYGWGIHWFPGCVIYNVSGFRAVELDMGERRRIRIGSDEPEKLREAVAALGGAGAFGILRRNSHTSGSGESPCPRTRSSAG